MKFLDLQNHRISQGLCAYCGEGKLLSTRCCRKCLEKRREAQRKRTKFKPQEESGRGRPMLS